MSTLFVNEPTRSSPNPWALGFRPAPGRPARGQLKISHTGAFANSVHASISSQIGLQKTTHSLTLQALALIALILIVGGLIVGYAIPGPITGLLLPLGLTLWFLVGRYARRND